MDFEAKEFTVVHDPDLADEDSLLAAVHTTGDETDNEFVATIGAQEQSPPVPESSLTEEEQRGIREGLTEEELALFDILTKPDPVLAKKEEAEVKKVVRELLEVLKAEKLVLDWRNRQQTKAAVRMCIEEELDKLPPTYETELWRTKCDLVFQHVFDAYAGEGRSIYEEAA